MNNQSVHNTSRTVQQIVDSKDWADSRLGASSSWPSILKNLLNTIFHNPSPCLVFWGHEYLSFYNDAYLKACGINFTEDDLGEPAISLFGNMWQYAQPVLDRIITEGKPLLAEYEKLPNLMQYAIDYAPYSFVPFVSPQNEVVAILVNYRRIGDENKIFEKIDDTRDELSFALGAAELGAWDYDPRNDYLVVNERICEWFGLDSQHLPLAHAVECIASRDRERVVHTIAEALQHEKPDDYICEYTIIHPRSGLERRVLAKGKAFFNEKGEAYRFRGTVQDITPVIRAMEKAEEAEERLRLAIEATELGTFELLMDGSDMIYTPRLAEIFGFPGNARLKHEDFKGQLVDQDVHIVSDSLQNSFKTGKYAYEARIRKENDGYAWIKTRGKVYYNPEGKPMKIIGTVEDITEEKESEYRLKQSEDKLRQFIEKAPFPIAIYEGLEMKVTMANKAVIDVWGKGPDVIGKTFLEVLPELEGLEFFDNLQRVYTSGISFEEKNRKVDLRIHGVLRTFYFDYIYTPLHDANGRVFGVMNTAVDLTDLAMAKFQLEESEARFRLLADSLPQIIWASDKYGNIDYFNKATLDYCGVSESVLQDGKWLEMVHPYDRKEGLRQWKESIETGKPYLIEHRFRAADGTYRWQLTRSLPLKDEKDEIVRWVGSSTDIEEIKEQEKQKDFFISVASHELKTPVTSIKAYVQILLKKYQTNNDEFLTRSLTAVEKQVNKLTGLIGELLDLSKIKAGSLSLKFQYFVLDELIEESVREILQSNSGIQINFYPKAEGLQVLADRERIGQVVTNLLSNAVKYTPKKEDIIVRSRILEKEVLVTIEDQGIGINKTDQNKIFQRFYRVGGASEETFPGFGIGLYLVKDIISRHNGTVGVESELGKGSVFYFTLPLTSPSA